MENRCLVGLKSSRTEATEGNVQGKEISKEKLQMDEAASDKLKSMDKWKENLQRVLYKWKLEWGLHSIEAG